MYLLKISGKETFIKTPRTVPTSVKGSISRVVL